MMKLSKAEIGRAASRAQSLSQRLSSFKKKAEATTGKVVHSVEVGAAAFTAGVIQGKTGGIEIVGVPLDLGLGLLLNLGGYFNLGGKMSDHLNGFGDGFLAAYLCTVGRGVGATWGEDKPEDKKQLPEAKGSGGFTDAELAAAARRAAFAG